MKNHNVISCYPYMANHLKESLQNWSVHVVAEQSNRVIALLEYLDQCDGIIEYACA